MNIAKCSICKNSSNLKSFKGLHICINCISLVKENRVYDFEATFHENFNEDTMFPLGKKEKL